MTAARINPIAEERSKIVLLAEDEVIVRLSTAADLRSAGYTVIEAVSADEAWIVLSSGTLIDFVLTDVQMPGRMDGIELAARARRLRPDLAIIIASGQAQGWQAGVVADLLLGKPYDIEQVLTWLKESTQ